MADARAKLAVGVVLAAGVAAVLATSVACQPHLCDGDFQVFTGGHMVDADTWESARLDEPWLEYPGLREWLLHMGPQMVGREIVTMTAYVSADQSPTSSDLPNWALASGDLGEFRARKEDSIVVRNNTCGAYFVRVVVHAAPIAAPRDAGSEAAAAGDAATDAAGD